MDHQAQKTINVTRSSMPSFEEYCAEIRELWDSRWLTNVGIKHRSLQSALAEYLEAPRVELLTNGHMAIELSLQALGLRGEVITTPFTFASTTQAIVRCGLTPVFCDIRPDTFCIDASKMEALITPRTCAIVPVHVYGMVCEVEEIARIARKYGLKVLYDAAHAFGVRYRGQGIGGFGDVSCFSFHATKDFHTIEGGGVCYQDEAFGVRLAHIKNFGFLRGASDADQVGANAKMNEFCAAMGLCNLRHVEEVREKRRAVWDRYRCRLKEIPGLYLPPLQEDVTPNYSYFPVIFDEREFGADRERVLEALAAEEVYARRYFYPLTSAFSCYHGAFDPRETPVALRLSKQILTLPLYAELELEMVDRICEIVLGCRGVGGKRDCLSLEA